ncbi:MAG: hypothetical protein HY615_11480 [Candidatus Rokubacteria bacterium]|nr:hypothetical protein [Candidatus Rokubacteria bacterium]
MHNSRPGIVERLGVARIGHVPVSVERTPPTLGRDTVEVLREVGYDDADIKALEAKGVTTPAFLDEE